MNRRDLFAWFGRLLPLALFPTAALAASRSGLEEKPDYPTTLKPVFRRGQIMDFVPRYYEPTPTPHRYIYDGAGWVQLDSWQGERLVAQLRAEYLVADRAARAAYCAEHPARVEIHRS